jgi:pSer/pThr/pTyr-binding forkhead associated (FHA) protein
MASFASATLTLDGPSGSVSTAITTGRLSLGRTPDNDVVVTDPATSGKHAELVVEDGQLVLRDLGSSNGTLVNGHRVEKIVLHDGDVIRIGQTQGRLQVLGTDGKPLRPATSKGPIFAVAGIVVLALGAGAAYFLMAAREREAEHVKFAAYEQKAAELLGRSPCQTVSKIQLDYLQKHDADAARLTWPKEGALPADARPVAEEVFAAAQKREGQATEIVNRLAERIAAQKAAAEELVKVKSELKEPALIGAVAAIDGLFAKQRDIATDFQHAWEGYGRSVHQLTTTLDAALKPDAVMTAVDPATLTTTSPTKLVEACEAGFRETKTKGLAQLAGLAQ